MREHSAYYSHGKLLLSGEYFVLDGAKAIGLPCQVGQTLEISPTTDYKIHWQSYTADANVWFEAVFQFEDLSILKSSELKVAQTLQQILQQVRILNPDFDADLSGFAGRTYLEFPRLWGLGSSSTLINNIAQWAEVNPFELSERTLGGSGYDIACASADGPIFYQLKNGKPCVEALAFNPPFAEHLYFVYLGRKQNSREGIRHYRKNRKDHRASIEGISAITEALVHCTDFTEFQALLLEHERIVSRAIGLTRVQENAFEDFRGVIKSLGAWGGDFVLAASAQEPSAIKEYFNKKGLKTFLKYEEMVIRRER